MCLIVYQPAGSKAIADTVFINGWSSNDDGAGYMFTDGDTLVIRKPFYKRKKLVESYKADFAKHGKQSAFVVHFRWATHGERNADNTHPHPIPMWDGTQSALVHNGILAVNPPQGMSDTAYFVQTTLAYRDSDQLHNESFCEWLGEVIGGNKFVIMSNDGSVSIVNPELGEWDGDYWYSNKGYKNPVTRYKSLGDWKADTTISLTTTTTTDRKSAEIVHPTDELFGYEVAGDGLDDDEEREELELARLADEEAFERAITRDNWDDLSDDEWRQRISRHEMAIQQKQDAEALRDLV